MRNLVILRGISGSGKSTFIKNMNLEPFTLSSDDIRLMHRAPQLTEGLFGRRISPLDNKATNELLLTLVEHRMKNGDFTVVDATHVDPKSFKPYLKLASRYRYRVHCIEFPTPLAVAKLWNKERVDYKQVTNITLESQFAKLSKRLNHNEQINYINVEDWDKCFSPTPEDISEYDKVHFIGDVQGCYSVLKEYIKDNGFSKSELYIFTGDLCDRGIENAEVLNFIQGISHYDNVRMVMGNHDQWLWNWAYGINRMPSDFNLNTKPALEEAGISKPAIVEMMRKFEDALWLKFDDKFVFVSHAGISNLNYNLNFISSSQCIYGVGSYNFPIDRVFTDNINEGYDDENDNPPVYQIHGHRNPSNILIDEYSNSFNLEGKVEFGGDLRIATLDKKVGFKFHYYKNSVFDTEAAAERLDKRGKL